VTGDAKPVCKRLFRQAGSQAQLAQIFLPARRSSQAHRYLSVKARGRRSTAARRGHEKNILLAGVISKDELVGAKQEDE
jgi:hypothetical protein